MRSRRRKGKPTTNILCASAIIHEHYSYTRDSLSALRHERSQKHQVTWSMEPFCFQGYRNIGLKMDLVCRLPENIQRKNIRERFA